MPQVYAQAWWGTWWPWAEANQGLLSVAALVVALILALAENRRANVAEARARTFAERRERALVREHIVAASRLAEMLKERISGCRFRVAGWEPNVARPEIVLPNSGRETAEALRMLATTGRASPELLIATLGLAAIADLAAGLLHRPFTPDGWRAWFDTIDRGLDREVAVIEALSPPPEPN